MGLSAAAPVAAKADDLVEVVRFPSTIGLEDMDSLYKHCYTSLNLVEDSDDAVYVFAESVLYLLGQTKAFAFQNIVRAYCIDVSAKVFRLSLCEHRYSNLNIKLYTIHLAKTNVSKSKLHAVASKFGITNRDAHLIWMLLRKNSWFLEQVHEAANLIAPDNAVQTLQQADALFTTLFPKILPYIKFITYSKLRFLAKSTNCELSDFHSELSAKIVQSYYSMVPTEKSKEHLINYLKQAAHNHAINMIKANTTQKRGRLISTGFDSKNERQFSLLCVSSNQMPVQDDENSELDGEDTTLSGFELRFSVVEVLDKAKANKRKYKFLSLLLGEEDREFTNWLRSRGVCSVSDDNVDVQERVGAAEYTSYVSTYLCVSRKRVDSLFDSLRLQLAL